MYLSTAFRVELKTTPPWFHSGCLGCQGYILSEKHAHSHQHSLNIPDSNPETHYTNTYTIEVKTIEKVILFIYIEHMIFIGKAHCFDTYLVFPWYPILKRTCQGQSSNIETRE